MPRPFFLQDIPVGLFIKACRTKSIFLSVFTLTRGPEFPLLRSRLVPCSLYFLTLYQMVNFVGTVMPGNSMANNRLTSAKLSYLQWVRTMNERCWNVYRTIFIHQITLKPDRVDFPYLIFRVATLTN